MLLIHLEPALFSFDGGYGAIPVGISGGRSDGGDALLLGCGGSGGSLSLRVDDGLETLLLGGGGCGGGG